MRFACSSRCPRADRAAGLVPRDARSAARGLEPVGPQLLLERAAPRLAELLERHPERLDVRAVAVGRCGHREGPRHDLAQDAGDGVGHGRAVLGVQVGEQLDPEGDVALLVLGDVVHPRPEARQHVHPLEGVLDEVLGGLGERGLHHQVVERHRPGELQRAGVGPQLAGHPVQPAEDLAVAPGELPGGGLQRAGHRGRPHAGHLGHEAVEEDAVARLVGLLGGQHVGLLLARARRPGTATACR
jgi:hypothetical protein